MAKITRILQIAALAASCLIVGLGLLIAALNAAEPPQRAAPPGAAASANQAPDAAETAKRREAQKAVLQPLQTLVGGWKGVGLPKRGSNTGSWGETADWAWHFDQEGARLQATLTDGKYFSFLQIAPGEKAREFTLTGALPDGKSTEQFAGRLDDQGTLRAIRVAADKNANEAAPLPPDRPARITLKTLAEGDRLVVLYERANGANFARLAEVGSTRVGGKFGQGGAGPECVVTGGLGTIAVQHDGKTYYVCCSGCKEAFADDPQGILAEYQARKAREKK